MVNMKNMVRTALMAAVAASAFGGAVHAQLDQAIANARTGTAAGARTQVRVDQLDDQRTDIELEYRTVLQQVESQALFVEQQRVFIRSQENELTSLEQQIARVDGIERDLAPMMREMVQALENFINLDLPFQMEGEGGRLARIERLYTLIDNANVSPAERYRVILNAYEIESAYGRSLRTYDEEILEGGVPVVVAVLQVGRVAVIRQYPTGNRLTIRYVGSSDWVELNSSYGSNVAKAVRIAAEVTTPSVFLAPLPGPTDAR